MSEEQSRNEDDPNPPRHRIAARVRFGLNVKGLIWAAARDGQR